MSVNIAASMQVEMSAAMAPFMQQAPASMGIDEVWRTLYRHPIIGAALEIIDDEVFGGGLDTYYNDKPAADPLVAYVQQTMVPFLRTVLHTLIVQGVVPVKINERGDMAVPYVPEPGTYQISMNTAHYQTNYELNPLDTFSGSKDPKVFFLDYYKPLQGGILTSPLGRLLSDARFQAMLADATRALASKTFMRDSITSQAIECQKQRAEQRGTVDDDPRSRVLRNDIFPLPASQQPAAQQMPNPRSDLVELKQLFEQVACALLGVPRSLTISDKSVRGHEEAVNRSLTMRVQRWKRWLCEAAERTVQQMFARSLAKRAHANFRAVFGRLPETTAEQRAALGTVRISFSFPSNSLATAANLRELWTDGFFVSDEAYGEERFRMHGISLDKLAKTRRIPAGMEPQKGAGAGAGVKKRKAEKEEEKEDKEEAKKPKKGADET